MWGGSSWGAGVLGTVMFWVSVPKHMSMDLRGGSWLLWLGVHRAAMEGVPMQMVGRVPAVSP